MFCSNCGAKLEDSAVFCGECGTKVEAVAAAVVEETKEAVEEKVAEGEAAVEAAKEAVEAKVAEGEAAVEAAKEAVEAKVEEVKEAVQSAPAEEAPAATAPVAEPAKQEETPAPEKKKGGKGGVVALIIVLILVLAGGGVAAWYFTGDAYNSKKNMKQAEAAFAAGELADAKEYYEEALERDETLKDAYIKLADIAIQDGKYESAIKTLQKGIKKTKDVEGAKEELTAKLEATYIAAVDDKIKTASYTEALTMVDEAIAEMNTASLIQKKKDIYMKQIDGMMTQQSYWEAITIAQSGFSATSDKDFQEKIAEAYIAVAEQEAENNSYAYALGWIDQALFEVDSQKLKDAKVSLYKRWIDSLLAENNYNWAVQTATEGYDATNEEVFAELKVSIYKTWVDDYLSRGSYDRAIEILRTGVSETKSAELEAMLEEINAAEIMLSKKVTDVQTGESVVYSYNAKGQETSIQILDAYDNIIEYKTYEYDDEGNVSVFKAYDGNGVLQSEISYTWEVVDGKKQCSIVMYDGGGRMLSQEVVDEKFNTLSFTEYDVEDGSVTIMKEYEYDEAGNQLTEMVVTDEETTIRKNEYVYGDNGNLLEAVSYDEEGNVAVYRKYDEKGNILESVEYSADGEVVCTETSTYDTYGNQATYQIVSEEYNYHTQSVYAGDELLQYTYTDDITGDETTTFYTSAKDGNVRTMEKVEYFNGEVSNYEKQVSEYDEEGRLIVTEIIGNDNMVLGAEAYKYDEKGNEIYRYSSYYGDELEYSTTYEYGFPEK